VLLVDQSEVEHDCIAATCLIWPGEERLPKDVVAHPVGNAGSSLLLKVAQERIAQLVGHQYNHTTCVSALKEHKDRRIMA
jgi:hypothetical protein